MAKPAPKETARKPAKPDGPGLAGTVATVGVALSALSSVVLVLAGVDLHVVDLRHALHGLDALAAPLLLVGSFAAVLAGAQAWRTRQDAADAAIASLKDDAGETVARQLQAASDGFSTARAETAAAIKAIEARVDAFLGPELPRLRQENDRLREALEAREKADSEGLAAEIEALRRTNAELQDKITHWAVDTVDSRIERKSLHAA